jgi:hypothetical protein
VGQFQERVDAPEQNPIPRPVRENLSANLTQSRLQRIVTAQPIGMAHFSCVARGLLREKRTFLERLELA